MSGPREAGYALCRAGTKLLATREARKAETTARVAGDLFNV